MSEARILLWRDLPDPLAALPAIDKIFFAASNTRQFANDAAKAQFRERWLGRYLTHDPDHVLIAQTENGSITGYLVGSFDDPAQTSRFADIGYFAALAPVTARYPAHLHVNLDANARSHGTGSSLVLAFADRARRAGMPGMHVVTGKGARNAVFYQRLGFLERVVFPWHGVDLVLLGHDLTSIGH